MPDWNAKQMKLAVPPGPFKRLRLLEADARERINTAEARLSFASAVFNAARRMLEVAREEAEASRHVLDVASRNRKPIRLTDADIDELVKKRH